MLPLSIVILSHNRKSELETNLPPLASLIPQIELIVVDNASSDGSREFLQCFKIKHPSVILVLNEENRGVAGGRNTGFPLANRPFIVALDDDTFLPIATLQEIPGKFYQYPSAGVIAFNIVHPLTGELQNDHGDQPCQVANHHGAGFAFRAELFKITGGIDEECNFGAEELDFSIKVRAAGMGNLFLPELIAFHNSIPRKKVISQFRRIRREYNNVRIYFKYFPLGMAFRNSFRYLYWTVSSWKTLYGLISALQLFLAAGRGMVSGVRNRHHLPDEVVAFYNNPLLQPEFGNVPTVRKALWCKFSRLFK